MEKRVNIGKHGIIFKLIGEDILKYSFVIPCYNSAHTIGKVVDEIKEKMQELNETSYEIILVDDYSPDRTTKDVIFELANQENIRAIALAKNAGQENALMAGYRASSGDYVVSLDDDGQHPVNQLDRLINKLNEGYDVVIAHYANKKHSSFRNLGSKLNDKMEIDLLGKPKDLYIGSFFIAKRFVINKIIEYPNPYTYIRGLLLTATSNIANVEVDHRERLEGNSQYTLKKLIHLWSNGFTSFSVKPLRFATLVGSLVALFGFLFAIYVVINKLIHPEIQAGWSSLMAMMTFLIGITLCTLGMIGEYIGRIFISLNKSPQYVISETKNMNRENKTQS